MSTAVLFDRYGTVDELYVTDLPVPAPGPGEVVVRYAAIGVNPIDWKILRGDVADQLLLPLPAPMRRASSPQAFPSSCMYSPARITSHIWWRRPTCPSGRRKNASPCSAGHCTRDQRCRKATTLRLPGITECRPAVAPGPANGR